MSKNATRYQAKGRPEVQDVDYDCDPKSELKVGFIPYLANQKFNELTRSEAQDGNLYLTHVLDKTAIPVPWNYNPWSRYRRIDKNASPVHKYVTKAKKAFGWIRSYASWPKTLKRVYDRCVSTRGINSPYQYGTVDSFIFSDRSPHAVNRRLLKAIRRADEITRAYGVQAPLRVIGQCYSETPNARPHKLGRRIARAALIDAFSFAEGHHDVFQFCRGLKQYLALEPQFKQVVMELMYSDSLSLLQAIEKSKESVHEVVDGIEHWTVPGEVTIDHGVTIQKIVINRAGHWTWMYLYRLGERTYHYQYEGRGETKYVLKQWKHQQKLDKEVERDLQYDKSKFSILVHLEDSRDAGNCAEGTRKWMESVGINRSVVPLHSLTKYAGFDRVRRTLRVALNRAKYDYEQFGAKD